MEDAGSIVRPDDRILVTGAGGFIGSVVVRTLFERGFRNLRCLVRPSRDLRKLQAIIDEADDASSVELLTGNLLSREDCLAATGDVAVVYHLAAATGEKSFPDAVLNSVVATRNLLDAALAHRQLRRLVNVSSFSVYSNLGKPRPGLLDESCPVEKHPALRGDAYTFAKVKQDEIVQEYGERRGLPYVIVRPGWVYGPGRRGISNRVGIGTFGIFLHVGGRNTVPLTFVDNCADGIVLAGLREGIDGQVFNVVDDDLPSSRELLRLYKRHIGSFRSVDVPPALSFLLCVLWEKYSSWSNGQLPPVHNRRSWHAYWKKTGYSNQKAKHLLDWTPRVATHEGLERYFRSCLEVAEHA